MIIDFDGKFKCHCLTDACSKAVEALGGQNFIFRVEEIYSRKEEWRLMECLDKKKLYVKQEHGEVDCEMVVVGVSQQATKKEAEKEVFLKQEESEYIESF